MFVDLVWLVEFLELVNQLKAVYDALLELTDDPEEPDVIPLTDAQRLEVLKNATLTVHLLRLDIACFPLTDASVVFYDSVGAPIPLECLD